MIAATAAVAKVAAAAAASSPYSTYMPTVAVTPMAQSHRMKRSPPIDSKSIKTEKSLQEYAAISSNIMNPLNFSAVQHQQPNGVFGISGGVSNVKILSKSKDSRELNGLEGRNIQSSAQLAIGNGGSLDRSMGGAPISGSANGRLVSSLASKQQARYDCTLADK